LHARPQEEQRFDLTPEQRTQLEAVNKAINREILPVTDVELWCG
jgi:predicted transglutaminase-like cysteine proteinase